MHTLAFDTSRVGFFATHVTMKNIILVLLKCSMHFFKYIIYRLYICIWHLVVPNAHFI